MGTYELAIVSKSGKGIDTSLIKVLDEMHGMGFDDGMKDAMEGLEPVNELGSGFLAYADQSGGNAVPLSRVMSIEYTNGYDEGYAAGLQKRQQARHVYAGGLK